MSRTKCERQICGFEGLTVDDAGPRGLVVLRLCTKLAAKELENIYRQWGNFSTHSRGRRSFVAGIAYMQTLGTCDQAQ